MGHLLAAVLFAGLGAAAAQHPGGQTPDARTLLGLEDEWAAALVRRDAATFRRLLADGFVYTEDDRMLGRDAVLRDIVAGTDTVEAAHNEDMRVHSFGTTAVVTGWLVVRGRGANGPFDRRYRFTDTWARGGGGGGGGGHWQIVAAHDYLVPARPR
ncbi:MAG TPA: nuclear transport factor 2 family protein [Gemmatimonadales bacterium]|nr:nuclear transport factor 2 family protein [Gemmatimonadales bacterium]